jgi:trehalose utilization protein
MLNRRALMSTALLGGAALLTDRPGAAAAKPIRVVVWDEQQPKQKEAYSNFLGNEIADNLRRVGKAGKGQRELAVRSVRLDDPEQGLSSEVLDNCDVLVWWGHQRHGEVKVATAEAIVQRVITGQLSLIALHSAHWSTPFIEAMNARAVADAISGLSKEEQAKVKLTKVQPEKRLYRKDEPLTPSSKKTAQADGTLLLEVRLPSCVFSGVKDSGTPSHVRTLLKNHPIARGVPAAFDIPQTEIYDGPFHVPAPDAIIFDERWDGGETFPAGCLWKMNLGKVFYFRPGHETYPIFKQPEVMRIVENAARWLGEKKQG